jgi:hypothetical protein
VGDRWSLVAGAGEAEAELVRKDRERGVKSWLSGSSRALKRSGGLGWLAILPTTGQPNSVCLADYPELKTAENTDPAARGFAPVAVAVAVVAVVAVGGQHRTVCGLRSAVCSLRRAAKQPGSGQSAFLLVVRVQLVQ